MLNFNKLIVIMGTECSVPWAMKLANRNFFFFFFQRKAFQNDRGIIRKKLFEIDSITNLKQVPNIT